jgi:hypothetical protein
MVCVLDTGVVLKSMVVVMMIMVMMMRMIASLTSLKLPRFVAKDFNMLKKVMNNVRI